MNRVASHDASSGSRVRIDRSVLNSDAHRANVIVPAVQPANPHAHAALRCDTRSHVVSSHVDWRFGSMSKT